MSMSDAMRTSLKNNRNLRGKRNKGLNDKYSYNFRKKSLKIGKMTDEELKVVRANKERIHQESKNRLFTAIVMIIVLLATITFFLVTA